VFCERLVKRDSELVLKGGILFIKSVFNFHTKRAESVVNMSEDDRDNALQILKEYVVFPPPVSPY